MLKAILALTVALSLDSVYTQNPCSGINNYIANTFDAISWRNSISYHDLKNKATVYDYQDGGNFTLYELGGGGTYIYLNGVCKHYTSGQSSRGGSGPGSTGGSGPGSTGGSGPGSTGGSGRGSGNGSGGSSGPGSAGGSGPGSAGGSGPGSAGGSGRGSGNGSGGGSGGIASRMQIDWSVDDFNGTPGMAYTAGGIRGILDTENCVEVLTYMSNNGRPTTVSFHTKTRTDNVDDEILERVNWARGVVAAAECEEIQQ